MYVDAQTLITAGAVLAALTAFVTLGWKLFVWINHQKEQDQEITNIKAQHKKDIDDLKDQHAKDIAEVKAMHHNESQKVGYIDKAYYKYYTRVGSIVHTPKWKNYYDFAFAEKRRLEFINSTTIFTEEEKAYLSKLVAETFLSKARRANKKARTREEKAKSRELLKVLPIIPKECKLKFKSRFYRKLLKFLY